MSLKIAGAIKNFGGQIKGLNILSSSGYRPEVFGKVIR